VEDPQREYTSWAATKSESPWFKREFMGMPDDPLFEYVFIEVTYKDREDFFLKFLNPFYGRGSTLKEFYRDIRGTSRDNISEKDMKKLKTCLKEDKSVWKIKIRDVKMVAPSLNWVDPVVGTYGLSEKHVYSVLKIELP